MEGPYIDNTWSVPVDGIDLRDWFAGQALAGIMSDSRISMVGNDMYRAELAYQIADAMLKARGGA